MTSENADLREAYIDELIALAEHEPRLVVLDADVSRTSRSRRFRDTYPDRHYNMGVAEQDMLGVAAGMAAAGLLPVTITFAVFTTMRACEQLRTSICYANQNVTVIGGYAGLSNSKDGATHHSIEDVAITRAFPGLSVLAPSDANMTRLAVRAAINHVGPVYIRLEYESAPLAPGRTEFSIGQGYRLRSGGDLTIASYGVAVWRALEAADVLAEDGIEADVLDMTSLKPLDTALLRESVGRTGALVSLEDPQRRRWPRLSHGSGTARGRPGPTLQGHRHRRYLHRISVPAERGAAQVRPGYECRRGRRTLGHRRDAGERRGDGSMTSDATPPGPVARIAAMAYQLRRDVVEMVHQGGSGHPGGSFSSAEIVATLYWHVLDVDPTNPRWEERDRFILSKGHSAPILYAALGEKGYFDTANFSKLRVIDSILQGHPDMNKTPGVDMTTGSLGQGLAAGLGMALAGRRLERGYAVYVLLSDGEVQEGMVWEAAMAAAHFKADRLTAIVDVNHLQTDGPTDTIMAIEPLADKWRAFGWHVQTVDGHASRH